MKSHGAMLSTSVESASFCLVLSDQVKMKIQYYKVSLKKPHLSMVFRPMMMQYVKDLKKIIVKSYSLRCAEKKDTKHRHGKHL